MTQDIKGPSADDLSQIWRNAPGIEEEQKEQARWESVLVRSNRAGAGGTKVGLPGIRPNGMAGSKQLEMLVPTGHKPKPMFSNTLKEPTVSKQVDLPPRKVLDRSFCPDCDRHDRPREGGAINASHFDQDMPSIGMRKNQLLITFFCQECLTKQRAVFDNPGSDIQVPVGDKFYTRKQVANAERLVRIKENTMSYLRAQAHNLVTDDD